MTTIKRLSHVGYGCTITLTYDTSDSITHYVGTPAVTQDLGVTLADDSCPDVATQSIDCGDASAWCTSYVAFDLTTGILTVSGTNTEEFPATVDVSLVLNEGEPNAETFTIELSLVDPCVADATVTLTQPGDWATSLWITDSATFAIDPDTELSQATDPAGADCGGYTTTFTLTKDGTAADDEDIDITTDNEITVDFNGDSTAAGTWSLKTESCLTDYSTICDEFTVTFEAKDGCIEATTIEIDEALLAAAWESSMNIYETESFVFDSENWVTVTTTGPTNTPNCGTIDIDFTLDPNTDDWLTVSPSTTATVDFAGDSDAV